jgi:shikimate kinase
MPKMRSGEEIACRGGGIALTSDVQQRRQIRNIALIGFMGTGKSSVGHSLASLLHFQMIDTDELIEREAGRPITEIFRQEGEARFRQYERDVVARLAACQRSVFATGGGLGANPDNLASLKTHALVVCLWASPDAIWNRVHRQCHRPLLNDPNPLGRIRTLLAEREPFYRRADVLVNTELRSIREVAHQVAHQFRLVRGYSPDEASHPAPRP